MINRIALVDGSWFDAGKARIFDEERDWNGENRVSRVTRSQWDHETLYFTASKAWVLHRWSQRQGVSETFGRIAPEHAARWLVRNGAFDSAPEAEAEIAKLEI